MTCPSYASEAAKTTIWFCGILRSNRIIACSCSGTRRCFVCRRLRLSPRKETSQVWPVPSLAQETSSASAISGLAWRIRPEQCSSLRFTIRIPLPGLSKVMQPRRARRRFKGVTIARVARHLFRTGRSSVWDWWAMPNATCVPGAAVLSKRSLTAKGPRCTSKKQSIRWSKTCLEEPFRPHLLPLSLTPLLQQGGPRSAKGLNRFSGFSAPSLLCLHKGL